MAAAMQPLSLAQAIIRHEHPQLTRKEKELFRFLVVP
jgi:hypothetical protein